MHLGAELLVGLHPCWFSFETHSYGGHTTNLFIVSEFPHSCSYSIWCFVVAYHGTAQRCTAWRDSFFVFVLGVLGRCHAFGR